MSSASGKFGQGAVSFNRIGANMKKILLNMGMLSVLVLSSPLFAATGEWWEVTGKMEMEGMPFAMPAQTSKVCLPKGAESDPRYTQGKDSNCTMTEVKHTGNTVRYKGSCVTQGETMNMVGETTHDGKSFKNNMKMSGKSGGESVNMSMVSSGKRIGGSCDTEELGRKAKAQIDAGMAQACDTSKYSTTNWVSSSTMFIGDKPSCPGKKDAMCKVLRKEVPRDVQAFQMLEQQEQSKDLPSVAKACNLNMDSIKKSLCKTKARSGPLSFLEISCPAEAKAYRELQRKQEECEGRGFTSGAKMKKCMGGEMLEAEARQENAKQAESDETDAGGVNTDTVLEGAKKLKGLFGF
jgi:Protein of unknown function (DUF3617)